MMSGAVAKGKGEEDVDAIFLGGLWLDMLAISSSVGCVESRYPSSVWRVGRCEDLPTSGYLVD